MEGGGESAGQYYTHTPFPGIQLFTVNSNVGRKGAPEAEREFAAQQMQWLERSLRESTARFKLLTFHHPVHSTAQHDPPADWMDFPYDVWGANAVFTGHQHCYERLILSSKNRTADVDDSTRGGLVDDGSGRAWVGHDDIDTHDNDPDIDDSADSDTDNSDGDGAPIAAGADRAVPPGRDGIAWITNGLGGHPWLYELHNCDPYPGSQVRFNKHHGAMIGILSVPEEGGPSAEQTVDMCFYSVGDGVHRIDHFTL